jgi:hypothetical protein
MQLKKMNTTQRRLEMVRHFPDHRYVTWCTSAFSSAPIAKQNQKIKDIDLAVTI